MAAANAIDELRRPGHDGTIELFGTEPHLPYNRPPLSKGLLLGNEDEASIFVHDEQWYAYNSVELHLGTTVTGLDLDRNRIHAGSEESGYDRLLIATGSVTSRSTCPRSLVLPEPEVNHEKSSTARCLDPGHDRGRAADPAGHRRRPDVIAPVL